MAAPAAHFSLNDFILRRRGGCVDARARSHSSVSEGCPGSSGLYDSSRKWKPQFERNAAAVNAIARSRRAAMEFGDLAHDVKAQPQVRLVRRAFRAHRHHRFE